MATTRVHETTVLNRPVGIVWEAIKPLNFAFSSIVQKVDVEHGHQHEVGSFRKITYKDGTIQKVKVLELSDYRYSVTYELVESEPPTRVLSAIHTITLRRVTENNTTFIEWISDFSSDASQEVIQDSRFKKLEGFSDLRKLFN